MIFSFLPAFESKAADLAVGKQVTITGIARNAKLGAVVFSDGQTIYLKDKSSWELGILNETVRVSGVLQKFETPRATQKDGEWSAGVTEGETAYRLENFKWERVSTTTATNTKILRPSDLLASPASYLNKEVEIEVVEALYGPSTPKALATLEYGQVQILIPDPSGAELTMVPAAFRVEDPNRYKNKFDRVLVSPLKVRGQFLSDDDLAKQSRRPRYVIRVASAEPLITTPPATLRSLSEVKADPSRWDRKPVIYEGVYEQRFEVSALDKEIWLAFKPQTEVLNKPTTPNQWGAFRVRVTGILFAKPGAHYGHLGGYPYEILASKIEYLAKAP
jgi:hypothetical protein